MAIAVFCIILPASQTSLGATYTYTPTNSTTDIWSAGTNWDLPPIPDSTTRLTFVDNNATILSDSLANTNTNDVAGAFALNLLDLRGTGPAGGAATININSSSASSYLNFVTDGSTAPVVNLDGLAGIAGLTYNVNSNVTLANNTTFQGDGTAHFNFLGAISGEGGLTKSGTSTLMLGGSNTYGGLTMINGGTLVIRNASALSNSTLDYNSYGGSLNFYILSAADIGGLQGNQDLALKDLWSRGVALRVGGNNSSGTYSGVLDDSGAITVGSLTKQGTGTLILAGANAYRGSTSINGGTLQLSGGDNRLPTTTTVTLANTAGAVLDINGQNQTIASLSGGGANGGNVLLGSGTLTIAMTASTTYAGAIRGAGGSLIVQGSGTLTLSGANDYTGPTTIDAGKLRLSGGSNRLPTTTAVTLANAAGAAFDLNGQNQTLASLSGGGSSGGNVTLGSGTLTVGDGNDASYAGIISGAGGNLIKQGSGTLTLTRDNTFTGSVAVNDGTLALSGKHTYSGMTTINGGTLRLTGGSNRLPTTTAVTLANATGAVLDLNGQSQTIASLGGGGGKGGNVTLASGSLTMGDGNSTTYGGIISGTNGNLIKRGSGILTLSNANTYSGATTINAGTIRLSGGSNRLPTSTSVTLASGASAVLDLNGQDQTLPGLIGGTGSTVALGSGTLTLAHGTYSGTMSGSGSLVMQGGSSDRMFLQGLNTYTGSTTINSGVLLADTPLPATTAVTLADNPDAQLQVRCQYQTIASLSGGGSVRLTTAHSTDTTLTVGDEHDTTYSGIISSGNLSVVGHLVKQGSGTLTLTGANTYAGSTIVNGGTLILAAANSGSASTTINVGTLRLSGGDDTLKTSTAVTLADVAGATLDVNNQNQTIASLSGGGGNGGNVTLGTGTLAVTGGTYAGVISGNGGNLVVNGGTLTLSRASTYTGATTVNSGGKLIYGADDVICAGAVTLNGGLAILAMNGHTDTVGTVTMDGGGSITGAGTLTSTTTFEMKSGSVSATLAGPATPLNKTGDGRVYLNGPNTFGGGTTLAAGTLIINNATALGTGSLTISGTSTIGNWSGAAITLANNNPQAWNADFTFDGNHELNLGSGTVTLGGDRQVTVSVGTLTVGGAIGGNYSLTKAGASTLTLTGNNTYGGGTTISGGTLCFGNNALGPGPIAFNGGALQWAWGNTQDISSSIAPIADGQAAILDVAGGLGPTHSVVLASPLSGLGGLTKVGLGTLALTGANSYTGPTTISKGALSFASGCLDSSSSIVFNGGALQWASGNTQDVSGRIAAIAGGKTAFLDVNDNHVPFASALTGDGSLTKVGAGTLMFTSANTYSGITTVSAGALQLGNGTTLNGSVAGNIVNDAALVFANPTDQTYSGVISGNGSLTKTAAGKLTLSSAGSCYGDTRISGGTFILGDDNALRGNMLDYNGYGGTLSFGTLASATLRGLRGNQSLPLTNAGGAPMALTVSGGNQTYDNYSGVLSGTGSLTKTGDVTLTLAGANTYTGGTNIVAGTLRLGADNTLPIDGTVTFGGPGNYYGMLDLAGYDQQVGGMAVAPGTTAANQRIAIGPNGVSDTSTLTFNGAGASVFGGAIQDTFGSGPQKVSLTVSGGTLTLSGPNSYTGDTVINAGTLVLGADNTLPTGSSVVLGGGTLATETFSQTNTLGALTLSGDSAVDMGELDSSILKFADSHLISWSGTLTVANWYGSLDGGGADELFFGSSDSGLTSGQLNDIVFTNPNGYSGNYQARILATGEIVPVPEPTMVALSLSGGLLLGGLALRRWACGRARQGGGRQQVA
ncbi:MAG: autotransporter-associated beta strand repeat-containing protein [Planctomycetia bacterium]|nr:autotransporter-associated beta strand repeat-containing protein [Planctomycetia bacterium]